MAEKPRMRKTTLALVPERSPVYRFHPLSRLIFFVVTGFIPIFIDLPEIHVIIIVGLVALFKWSKVNLSSLKIYAPMIVTVGIFIFLTYIVFPGKNDSYTILGSVWGKTIYYEPIRWAIVSYVRIVALIIASIFYFSTNRERDILAAFRSAKIPFLICYFIGVALRAAGMFLEDLKVIREAEQARGLDYSSLKWKDKAKLYSMYMIPLFTIALRRGDEISNALFVKGYSFKVSKNRSDYILTKFAFQARDKFVSALLILGFILIALIRIQSDVFTVDHSVVNVLFNNLIY